MSKRTKIAKKEHIVPTSFGLDSSRKFHVASAWRSTRGNESTYDGIYVFVPVDPYTQTERREFRTATENPYVYKAIRTTATMVVGQGYTTTVVPRNEEELPAEQREQFSTQTLYVPYFDRDMTIEQIKDFVDKLALKLDLQTNVFNAYTTEMEQGRAVIAMLPLNRNEDTGMYQMPQQLKLIRPEHTLRPIVAQDDAGELIGCQVTGAKSKDGVVSAKRMVYLTNGFNNQLFADYYGDSKVARISDLANALSVILTQDYPNAAKNAWFKPRVWAIPIPPQEYGNEKSVITQFMNEINHSEGKDIGVTGPSNKDDIGVQVVGGEGTRVDTGGLETIRLGVIKAIITAFGLPSFMLDEGDFGPLGGNSQLTQLDTYLNTEIKPERLNLEVTLEKQFYDRVLCVLFNVEHEHQVPIKIKHKFNKPKLWTLLTPEMFSVFMQMAQAQLIDIDGIRDILGLEELDKETMSLGNDQTPNQVTAIPINPITSNVTTAGVSPTGTNVTINGWSP